MTSALSPVIHELSRIAGAVESDRAAAVGAEISALRDEVAQLRLAVAHLRASAQPVPAALRPVVARAMVATAEHARAV